MKHIMTIIVVAGLTLGVQAQRHENHVGVNLGGGLNTMTCGPVQGSQSLGWGFDAGLRYTHFFNERFGLGLGVHHTRANAHTTYDFSETSTGLTHASNTHVRYNLTARFDGWEERQTVDVIGIPVEAFYRVALDGKWSLIGGLGVQLDLPVSGSYGAGEGRYSTSGTFQALGSYVVSDMPEHGFSTYDATHDAKMDNLATVVSLIADLGVRYALNGSWGLYFGLYGSYGLTDMLGEQRDNALLTLNPADASKIDYNGTYASNEITSLHLLRAGVRVGVDFGWPAVKLPGEEPLLMPADNRLAEEQAACEAVDREIATERTRRREVEKEMNARRKEIADRGIFMYPYVAVDVADYRRPAPEGNDYDARLDAACATRRNAEAALFAERASRERAESELRVCRLVLLYLSRNVDGR